MVKRTEPQMVEVTLRVAGPIARAWEKFKSKPSRQTDGGVDGAALLLAMDADADIERKPARKAALAVLQDPTHDPLEVLAAMRYIARCRREVEVERWADSGPECHAYVQKLRKRHQFKALEDARAFGRVFLDE